MRPRRGPICFPWQVKAFKDWRETLKFLLMTSKACGHMAGDPCVAVGRHPLHPPNPTVDLGWDSYGDVLHVHVCYLSGALLQMSSRGI